MHGTAFYMDPPKSTTSTKGGGLKGVLVIYLNVQNKKRKNLKIMLQIRCLNSSNKIKLDDCQKYIITMIIPSA